MKEILDYLKKHGECIDAEISEGTGIPLAPLHQHLAELTTKGEIMTCHATRFEEGRKSEVIISRLVGHFFNATKKRYGCKDIPRSDCSGLPDSSAPKITGSAGSRKC